MKQEKYWHTIGEHEVANFDQLCKSVAKLSPLEKIQFDCYSQRFMALLLEANVEFYFARLFDGEFSDEVSSFCFINTLMRGRRVYNEVLMSPEKLVESDIAWLDNEPPYNALTIGIDLSLSSVGEEKTVAAINAIFGTPSEYKKFNRQLTEKFAEKRSFEYQSIYDL